MERMEIMEKSMMILRIHARGNAAMSVARPSRAGRPQAAWSTEP